jgi:hypothetical protein
MNTFINQLIRPYRFNYSIIDLGKKKTNLYERFDSFAYNHHKLKIYYSYFKNKV